MRWAAVGLRPVPLCCPPPEYIFEVTEPESLSKGRPPPLGQGEGLENLPGLPSQALLLLVAHSLGWAEETH